MPGHGWYEGDESIRYRRWVDSLYCGIRDDQREMLYQAPLSKPFIVKELVRKEDLKCLKADFLIRHIERSFRAWQHLPWLSDLPFGDFCEYVLPYRCADENPYTSACVADSAAMEQLRQMVLKYDDVAHEPGLLKSVYSPAGHYITLPGSFLYAIPCTGRRGSCPAAVFDNDALTCSYVDRWVGADFGRAVRPVLARCIGRNDDNGIWPGHIYELLYRGSEEWVSLGMQEAQTETLNYSNVPAGCLLLLKNYTRGREERLFTCDEKGTIRFW